MSGLETQTGSFYHLIYTSSATKRLSQDQILNLLLISRRNNEARGLTGMLLYRDGLYLQYLEGYRSGVEKLLNYLRGDPRHHDIRILRQGTLPERLFPEWSMAYKNMAGIRADNVPGYSERLQAHYVNDADEKGPVDLLVDLFHQVLMTSSKSASQRRASK